MLGEEIKIDNAKRVMSHPDFIARILKVDD